MSLGSHLRLTVAVVGVTIVVVLYYLRTDELQMGWYQGYHLSTERVEESNEIPLEPGYLVWSPQCKILNIDPWHSTIKEYLVPTKPVVCSNIPLLTFIERRENVGNVLKIDQDVVGKYKVHPSHRLSCCYSIISRISQTVEKYDNKADSSYSISDCKPFKKEVVLSNTTEFIIAKCHSIKVRHKDGKEVYKNGHAIVPLHPHVTERLQKQNRTEKKLSVMIIGVDSVSRLNMRRTMPKTLQHLEEHGWVELQGYNKIEDNTFPNLMAILSGENMKQIREQCYVDPKKKMDDCPIIWKSFREKGYVTAYAEDVPTLGTFNYLQTGFVEPPTDVYMRPFMLATHDVLTKKVKDGLCVCVGPTAAADHILRYAKDFAETYKDHNYFGLFWTNSLSHNDVNSPGAIDLRVVNLLNELSNVGANNDTVIFLLSDHGTRFGGIRKTFVGYLEERLPFMFIWMPEWFRRKYKSRFNNLIINRNRLTTPYDVYVTIKELLDEDDNEVALRTSLSKACPKCVSLFDRVPYNRSCEDAQIEPHWCMCPDFREVAPTDAIAVQTGHFLFGKIKSRLEELLLKEKLKEPTCANWTFSSVVRAHQSMPVLTGQKANSSEEVVALSEMFVVIVELSPGGALFEATIQVNRTEPPLGPPVMNTMGFISRLDSYVSSTKCVRSRLLKFYCYCLNK